MRRWQSSATIRSISNFHCRRLVPSWRPLPTPPVWRGPHESRGLHIAPLLQPPLIFLGSFLALWTWKCIMMVLMQNTIIYSPYLPPDARSMRIANFERYCGGIQWRKERIRSLDGTDIALCVTDISAKSTAKKMPRPETPVYILYFQGNASSIPPRLPDLSSILRRVLENGQSARYTLVCVSYRGYWTSHDRPSEKGINQDGEAAFRWLSELHHQQAAAQDAPDPVVILWGQSIGCGFATNLAASTDTELNLPIDALVLETPFTSVRSMLTAMYPQKWLPYKYLHPFLRNHLDSWKNMAKIASQARGKRPPAVYIIEAGRDELVPGDHGAKLEQRCFQVDIPVERKTVRGALHNEVMVKSAGKDAIAQSILSAVASAGKCTPTKIRI